MYRGRPAGWGDRLILDGLLALVLAVCYGASEEIVDSGLAEEVPTLPGRFSLGEGAFMVITDQSGSKDSPYQETDPGGEMSTSSFRASICATISISRKSCPTTSAYSPPSSDTRCHSR